MRAIGTGLYAAMMLARGRPEAMQLLAQDNDLAMAARSFWAAALCLPAFICLHALDWAQTGMPAQPARGFALDLLGYVIGWVGFALLSRHLAIALGRGARWPRFVAMWNWCNVIQYFILVIAAVPDLLGLPDIVGQTAWLAAMGWALWLEWYATRLTLDLSGLTAAALVGLDVALGLFVVGFTGSMG